MKSQRTSLGSESRIEVPGRSETSTDASEPQSYAFGPFRLAPEEHILRRGSDILPLPPKAFETLLLLVRNPGHLMLKEVLMTSLWPDSFVEEVGLANQISLLRKVLKDNRANAAYIQTVSKLGYRFLPPVTRTWAAGSTAGTATRAPAEVPAERAIRFIALPFTILNGDERIAFLGHSLPEAVSISLAGLRSLTVRSSLLAARLAEGLPDPRRIAAEAEVDMLLAGTILCEGSQLRVTAELVHGPTGAVVGSHVCLTGRDNLIEVQDSLVRGIVNLLMLRLSKREQMALANDVPNSARAYEFYLRAGHVQRVRTLENMSIARDLYRASVDEDPDYAPAWARLARCYRFLQKLGQDGPVSLEQAKWAFHRAFALNPDLPLAHNLFTPVEADSGHAKEAIVRLLGQEEKRPNDPELFAGLVQACRYCGLLEESIRAHCRARALDPGIETSVAHTYFLQGDYPSALGSTPASAKYYLDLAALSAVGQEAEAAELARRRDCPGGGFPAMIGSLLLCLQGDHAGSLAIVRKELAQQPGMDPEAKFYLARHLARDGAHAEALGVIRELAAAGFYCSTALRNDPWLRPLSQLPDFPDVLADILAREADARAAFQRAGGDKRLS